MAMATVDVNACTTLRGTKEMKFLIPHNGCDLNHEP